jgi:hypothetical protein
MKHSYVKIKLLLMAILLMGIPVLSLGQSAVGKKASKARQIAYGKSGEWLYEGLKTLSFPKTRPIRKKERIFKLPVDWALQEEENKEELPVFDISAMDYSRYSKNATAYLMGFKTLYHADGIKLFDSYFDHVEKSQYVTKEQKKDIRENADLMRDRSMVFYLAFNRKEVQLVYYPGKIQFKGGDRTQMTEWLPDTPEEIKDGSRTDYALIKNTRGLLAIFEGCFDKIDNFVHWEKEETKIRYGGFGYDFTPLMASQPEMATFAIYRNSHTAIGTYRNLPYQNKIHSFVQNRFMVIENGKPAKDADPNAFFAFHDNIARAYLFTDKYGRIGYLWTLYTPPQVLAPLALQMGIRNMMLLDIHAPISCSIADPKGPLLFSSFRDYMNRSFDLVPNFFKMSGMKASAAWLSKALDSRIQTQYALEAFQQGTEDYFAVFLRGTPEAERMRKTIKKTANTKTFIRMKVR